MIGGDEMSYIKLLRQRLPLTLWIGQAASAAGNRLYGMAMLWLALRLTGSPAVMSATAVAESISLLVVGMLAGPIIDRANRLQLALWVDLVRGGLVLGVPIAHGFGVLSVGLLISAGIAMGALDAFFGPAFESALPELVPQEDFPGLAGLMDTPARFARLAGPGIAGMLLSVMSVFGFFIIDSGSFFASAMTLFVALRWQAKETRCGMLQHGLPKSVTLSKGSGKSRSLSLGAKRLSGNILRHLKALMADAKRGLDVVWLDIPTRSIFLADGIGNSAFVAYTLGALVLVTRELHLGLGAYGWMIGAYGAGSLLGNFMGGNVVPPQWRLRLAVAGWLGIGSGFIVVGMSKSLLLSLLAIAFAGVSGALAHVSRAVYIGSRISSGELGKVYSLRNLVNTLSASLGTVICGWLLSRFAPSDVLLWSGVFIVMTDVLLLTWLGIALHPAKKALAAVNK